MRVPTDKAQRGSQKWIQDIINANGDLLTRLIQQSLPELMAKDIIWLSPLEEDHFAEYLDRSFLDRLGLRHHSEALGEFWPARGPQWDGLGRATDISACFLIEAKANIPELISDCGAKSSSSRERIKASLLKTQLWLKATPHIDWMMGFYQYANRLAHLYFLSEIAGVKAFLICLYLVHDTTHQPTGSEQWKGALQLQKRLMSLPEHRLNNLVIDVFMNTDEIKKRVESVDVLGRPEVAGEDP
jgi:hypothetical protein